MKRMMLWMDAHHSKVKEWFIASLAILSLFLGMLLSIQVTLLVHALDDAGRWVVEMNAWGTEQEEKVNQLSQQVADLQRQLEATRP